MLKAMLVAALAATLQFPEYKPEIRYENSVVKRHAYAQCPPDRVDLAVIQEQSIKGPIVSSPVLHLYLNDDPQSFLSFTLEELPQYILTKGNICEYVKKQLKPQLSR